MIEVKSGDTYTGTLENIDRFMNIKLIDAIMTSKDGQSFMKMKEIFIKGFCIKYFQLHDQAIEKAIEDAEIYNDAKEAAKKKMQQQKKPNREYGKGGGRSNFNKGKGQGGNRGGYQGGARGRGK